MSVAPSFADDLDVLRKQFAARLPSKLSELDVVIARADSDADCVVDAIKLAHRLRGSAGSYGFPEIGETMGLVEELLLQATTAPLPAPQSLWTEVTALLQQARRLSQASEGPT